MRFIVDAMFGRLARWLRMSGYDTVYDVSLGDGRIVMIAKEDGRVVITRDRDVYRRALKEGVKATFIVSLDFVEQLRQLELEQDVEFRAEPVLARCPVCNAELAEVDKKDIKAQVPDKVLEVNDEYWSCTECGKVYWRGGHWKNIEETIMRMRNR